jgi:integrase
MTGQPTFPTLLERFFTQRLMQQRQASTHTIASYRDTFRLLLQFAQKRLRRAPSALALEDIDAPLVVYFLDELEKVRDVTARTRNLRLSAIHSFFRYVAFEAPGHAAQTQRVLAIPAKRFTRALVPFPEQTGSRCTTRGTGSTYMVRAARSLPHSACGADRITASRRRKRASCPLASAI